MRLRSWISAILLLSLFSLLASAQSSLGAISGTVLDPSGAVVAGAEVKLRRPAAALELTARSDAAGVFRFDSLAPGEYQLLATASTFSVENQRITLKSAEQRSVQITLHPGSFTEEVTVHGTQLISNGDVALRIPGSVDVLDSETLEHSRVQSTSEALRKVAGVNVRDEEGFGLRPNIGIRGLNPTRSTKVLLLEDGIPLAFAPYGDNASYYHPPIERFSSVEVLKGSGQILYGPQTVGGVINYVTPNPPAGFGGHVRLMGGNRNYLNGDLSLGGTLGDTGVLFSYMRKQGDGARDNIRSGLDDYTLKVTSNLTSRQALTWRANFYREDSNITYSGLTLAEYEADPRQNPFRNDFFYGDRWGTSLTHSYAISGRVLLTTNAYGSLFSRRWWRQSSNSAQRPIDAADPACGGMQNLNTTCGNIGNVRKYTTVGIEPRLHISHSLFGLRNETEVGVRAHFEVQDRRQHLGPFPDSRSGPLAEDNERRNDAYSAFVQNRFMWRGLALTPGVRIERIFVERTNRLANGGAGVTGDTALTQVVPGIGAAYNIADKVTLFAGVHRGFAPPRAEDVISNSTGGVVELDPELSWNYEAGFRTSAFRGVQLDATFFRMDYENQIVPASLAGGAGAVLTNGGETLHQGFEMSARVDTGTLRRSPNNIYFRTAYTFVPVAEFTGTRFSSISGFQNVSVTGNRLPYAPDHLFTGSVGYSHPVGLDFFVEAVRISGQYSDDLNTVASTPDGQRGLIPGNTTWNATLNYHLEQWNSTLFVTAKNLLDETFIVDRSRGIIPNNPRLVQTGIKFTF